MNNGFQDSDADSFVIPVRSERQALDWSLVLASQEISATIARSDGHWTLVIDPRDRDRAVASLKQYVAENRRWKWQESIGWHRFSFDEAAIVWCLFLIVVYAMTVYWNPAFRDAGMMHSAAVRQGEWWRLFTAILLHHDLAHLMANTVLGGVLLSLAMGRYGSSAGLLAAYLSGAGGNIAGLLLYTDPYRSIGASGMVMGALGLLTVQSVADWREERIIGKQVARAMIAGLLLFVLVGLNPDSDVLAHAGGFVSGIAIGGLLFLFPANWLRSPRAAALLTALFVTLLVATATLALRQI